MNENYAKFVVGLMMSLHNLYNYYKIWIILNKT